MGTYKVNYTKTAKKDIGKIQKSGTNSEKKRLAMIADYLSDNPYTEALGWEHLKFCGKYSYELNKKDRIYFDIDEDNKEVYVLSCLGHYDDK